MSLTVQVPTRTLPDGRIFISDEDYLQYPWVREFVDRFSNYWTHDFDMCGYVSPHDDD
jgi:hypothetical protein